jgi:hypothetical protein
MGVATRCSTRALGRRHDQQRVVAAAAERDDAGGGRAAGKCALAARVIGGLGKKRVQRLLGLRTLALGVHVQDGQACAQAVHQLRHGRDGGMAGLGKIGGKDQVGGGGLHGWLRGQ